MARHKAKNKKACQAVQKAREKLVLEEAELRRNSANSVGGPYSVPPRVFEECVGDFWGILETRDYLEARVAFTDALLVIDTVDAVELVISEYYDLLRLCTEDALEIRHRLPAQLLQLGRDQECYELLKLWALEELNLNEPQDPEPLRRRYDNSDALEDPKRALNLSEHGPEIQRLMPTLLLKIILWLNVRELQEAALVLVKYRRAIPAELIVNIQLRLASPAILNSPAILSDIRNCKDLEPHMATLKNHVGLICKAIDRTLDGDFWELLKDKKYLGETELLTWMCNMDEQPAWLAIKRNERAWAGIPHALGILELLAPTRYYRGPWREGWNDGWRAAYSKEFDEDV